MRSSRNSFKIEKELLGHTSPTCVSVSRYLKYLKCFTSGGLQTIRRLTVWFEGRDVSRSLSLLPSNISILQVAATNFSPTGVVIHDSDAWTDVEKNGDDSKDCEVDVMWTHDVKITKISVDILTEYNMTDWLCQKSRVFRTNDGHGGCGTCRNSMDVMKNGSVDVWRWPVEVSTRGKVKSIGTNGETLGSHEMIVCWFVSWRQRFMRMMLIWRDSI